MTDTWVQGWMINKWTMELDRGDYIIGENLHKKGEKDEKRETEQDLL